MRRTSARAPLALSAIALLALPAAGSAASSITVDGWDAMAADMDRTHLVFTDAAAARTDRFTYWRTDVQRVRLTATGFRGRAEDVVAVRTSAGPMAAGSVRMAGSAGAFVVVAAGRGFAPPVIWCCDREDTQVVVESDGRADAPVALAAALDRGRVRMLARRGAGTLLVSADPSESAPRRTQVGFPGRPGPGQAAIAPGLVAWADTPAYGRGQVVRTGVPGDAGVRSVRTIAQPGPVLGVWAAPRLVVVATRVGGRVEIARHDLPAGRRRVVWRGAGVPPLAVGGGAVAVAEPGRVIAGRGAVLSAVRATRGVVAALATDGRRVAVFERGTRRTTGRRPKVQRVTVVRLGVVR